MFGEVPPSRRLIEALQQLLQGQSFSLAHADRLDDVVIHRDVRDRDKPSDHVPVVVTLRD